MKSHFAYEMIDAVITGGTLFKAAIPRELTRRKIWCYYDPTAGFVQGAETDLIFYNNSEEVLRLPLWRRPSANAYHGLACNPSAFRQTATVMTAVKNFQCPPFSMTFNTAGLTEYFFIPPMDIQIEADTYEFYSGAGGTQTALLCILSQQ